MTKKILCIVMIFLLFPISGFAQLVHGPQTDEGYYSLSSAADGTLPIKGLVLLGFRENGNQRYMLALRKHTTSGYDLFDYFNNEKILSIEQKENSFDLKAVWISSYFFEADTCISLITIDDIHDYDWFWNMYPDLSSSRYADMRTFYETIVPANERFPRAQMLPENNPLSKIPRDRDNTLLCELGDIHIVEANYKNYETVDPVYFMSELRRTKTKDKNGKDTSEEYAYYEIFTDTWLYSETYPYKNGKHDNDHVTRSYNLEYITSIRNGEELGQSGDSTKKNPYYTIRAAAGPLRYMYTDLDLSEKSSFYLFLIPYMKKAQTIGDMRKIYEMLPKLYWFMPVSVPDPVVPAYASPDKSIHPVANEQQLIDAIETAKNGDTIVVLCDIRTVRPHFIIKNKTLKIIGLEGTKPRIWIDRDYNDGWLYYARHMFNIESANVTFENIIIDGEQLIRGFLAQGKSTVVFGSEMEITGCTGVIETNLNVKLDIVGANIHHNSRFVIKPYGDPAQLGSGTIRFLSGEIAYTNCGSYPLIDISNRGSSLLIDGGLIHDNIHCSNRGRGLICSILSSVVEFKDGRIFNNIVIEAADIIALEGGTFTMSGGELSGNLAVGFLSSIIGVYGTLGSKINPTPKSKFVMTGGKIYNNYIGITINGECNREYGAELIEIRSYKGASSATFDMKGGVIEQANQLSLIPDVEVVGIGAYLIISGGQFDPYPIECTEEGKQINKE